MDVRINNELGYTELILEEVEMYEEDYQMAMLRECKVMGLLPVIGCGVDDKSRYIYDVSGMYSLEKLYEKTPMGEYEIRQFSHQLLQVLDTLKQHMLNVKCILLDPEFIYKKGEDFYFCYFPLNKESINHRFHRLTQFFVQHIDYSEVDTVILACGLHKETMEDDYDLAQLLEEKSIIAEKTETIYLAQQGREAIGQDIWNVEEIDLEENLYTKTKELNLISKIAETPLSKIWGKEQKTTPFRKESSLKTLQKNKDMWGDWDELLRQEGYK